MVKSDYSVDSAPSVSPGREGRQEAVLSLRDQTAICGFWRAAGG